MSFVLRILSTLLLGVALPVAAQTQQASDYYFNRSDKAQMTLMANVEGFHLPGCLDGMKTRRYPQALADCEFILRYFPNHPRALLAAADLCIAWRDPRCQPGRYFEQAIEINPHAGATFVTQGIYLLRADRPGDAIEALKRAIAIEPNSVNAQYNIGIAYLETKQFERANEHAQRAYALGAPVPGLRDRLKKAGFWKVTDAPPAESRQSSSKDPGSDGAKK